MLQCGKKYIIRRYSGGALTTKYGSTYDEQNSLHYLQ